jgi:hypothetical protein
MMLERNEAASSGRGVYTISVAAELSGIPIQSLRLYEQRGLLNPERTARGTRRYSDGDLERLQRSPESARFWTCRTATPDCNPTTVSCCPPTPSSNPTMRI